MTPATLLTALRARGIRLVVGGDRIGAEGDLDLDVLTDGDRTGIREHKDALLALLRVEPGQARETPLPEEPGRPPGLLWLVRHPHRCPGCGRPFWCTAPSCAGKLIFCVVCKLAGRMGMPMRDTSR